MKRFALVALLALAACSRHGDGGGQQIVPDHISEEIVQEATRTDLSNPAAVAALGRVANNSNQSALEARIKSDCRETGPQAPPTHEGQYTIDLVTQKTGARCPIREESHEIRSHDLSVSAGAVNGVITSKTTSVQNVIDSKVRRETGRIRSTTDATASTHFVQYSKQNGKRTGLATMQMVGTIVSERVDGIWSGSMRAEIVSHDQESETALIVKVNTPKGLAILSILSRNRETQYRVAGRLVTRQQFKAILGTDFHGAINTL